MNADDMAVLRERLRVAWDKSQQKPMALTAVEEFSSWLEDRGVSIPERGLLDELMDKLWDSLGSGEMLEPGDYEQLRATYNKLAQAAEDACLVYQRQRAAT
jgi:hypothetical protein